MTELNNDIIDSRRTAKVDDGALNAIGVDVGGTKTAAGVAAPESKILNEVSYPTAEDPERLERSITQAIREVGDDYEIGGVCLAVPGLIRAQESKVIFSPDLHSIERISLKDELEPEIGFQITIENDASAAAWGEFRFGSGSDVDHLVFGTLNTGVGGSVISHGTLLPRALGHVTIQTNGPHRGRGNRGCLKSLASGPATQRRARSPSRGLVEIRQATLGPESGALSAAVLARDPNSGEYVLEGISN